MQHPFKTYAELVEEGILKKDKGAKINGSFVREQYDKGNSSDEAIEIWLMNICPHCKASLTETDSVNRTYVNKNDGEDLSASGHYDNGHFESDSFSGFDGDSYDCLDDSDTCASCDKQL